MIPSQSFSVILNCTWDHLCIFSSVNIIYFILHLELEKSNYRVNSLEISAIAFVKKTWCLWLAKIRAFTFNASGTSGYF